MIITKESYFPRGLTFKANLSKRESLSKIGMRDDKTFGNPGLLCQIACRKLISKTGRETRALIHQTHIRIPKHFSVKS